MCDKDLNETEPEYSCGDNSIAVEPPADPDYLVNSLVDIDGGTGNDRLTIVGTEFGDKYVVQDGKIFGGGLTIKFTNIQRLDVGKSRLSGISCSFQRPVRLSFVQWRTHLSTLIP